MTMTTLVVSATGAICLIGIVVTIWSIASTRNRYFDEYVERKKSD